MSKEMKLIMERWGKFKLQEKIELETVGQFKIFVKQHRAAEAGKEAGKFAVDTILGALPGIGNVYTVLKGTKTAVDSLNKIYGANDKIKSNTGLDALNVDDNVSKIVMGDDEPLPNATTELQSFLAASFEDNTVKK